MELSRMQKQYLKVFEQIKPHLDYMRTNALRFCHYKGWADIDSPMLYEPDILFIGINMGPGRYRNFGCLPPDFPTPWRSTLHYIKDGVARDKEWWNTSNGRIPKNLFPATICELLVRIYRHYEAFQSVERKELSNVFQQRIMATNLYPIVTENKAQLDKLLKQYDKETKIDLKQLCINRISELIRIVRPKCIVLLGRTVERDIKQHILDFTRNEGRDMPIFIINRKRGWHSRKNISKASDIIYRMICHD